MPTEMQCAASFPVLSKRPASQLSTLAHSKMAPLTILRKSPFSSRSNATSLIRWCCLQISRLSGVKLLNNAQQGLTKIAKLCQVEKAGGSPLEIEALGSLGYNLSATAPWNRAFPYKSPVINMTSEEMAAGYEKSSGKQVTKQLGSSMAVFDAGFESLKATANPLDKAALAKTISMLKATTTVGVIDFNSGPMPHVVATTPLVGTQYQKGAPGSKYKTAQVIVENSNDRNVPIT